MRIQLFGSAAVAAAVVTLVTSGSPNTAAGSPPTKTASASSSALTEAVTPDEAARFAKQVSFGPTPELISDIVAQKSLSAWLDGQFSLRTSTYADMAAKPVPASVCNGLYDAPFFDCQRDNLSATPVETRFYANAINNKDQLRQRVAFALSQILVASEVDVHGTAGVATFNQIFLDNAFGNYRDILKSVTLNPFMGDYLDMADNSKDQPNENYARELMQLFSIGTTLLNPDGTPQTDATGAAIPTYSNNDVKEVARALTGWIYSGLPKAAVIPDNNSRDLSKPLVPYTPRFDSGSKSFLGKTIPAGATQDANIDAVVDAVFYHPSTAPFISKRLIQQLTLANPSSAYVGRVAAVFVDNGAGTRGDMKAVVRAIYLDPEARAVSQQPGKVKEPVLLATSLARAIGLTTDGYAFTMRDASMGEAPFRAPSVFNFYPYNFPLPQGQGLVSPVTKLMTAPSTDYRHNFIYDWTIDSDTDRKEFKVQSNISGSTGTALNWASWEANGADDGKTLDRINLVLLNGTMTSAQRQALLTAMSNIKNTDPAQQTRKRAQMALYVVASSPLFQVDR